MSEGVVRAKRGWGGFGGNRRGPKCPSEPRTSGVHPEGAPRSEQAETTEMRDGTGSVTLVAAIATTMMAAMAIVLVAAVVMVVEVAV